MRKKRLTEKQMIGVLKAAEGGCRSRAVSLSRPAYGPQRRPVPVSARAMSLASARTEFSVKRL